MKFLKWYSLIISSIWLVFWMIVLIASIMLFPGNSIISILLVISIFVFIIVPTWYVVLQLFQNRYFNKYLCIYSIIASAVLVIVFVLKSIPDSGLSNGFIGAIVQIPIIVFIIRNTEW